MLRILKGIGYTLLAILVLGVLVSGGAIFAAIGTIISIAFIGAMIVGFIAILIKEVFEHK